MNLAYLTLATGNRKLGLPPLSGAIIMGVDKADVPDQPPGAKTLIRYALAGDEGSRIAWVTDPFDHVLKVLPVSVFGPWARMVVEDGNKIAFPQGSVCAFEELEGERVRTTVSFPNGTIDLILRGDVAALEASQAIDVEPAG